MTRRQMMLTGAYALASFGLTLALFRPQPLNAQGETRRPARIDRSKLVVNGCELSLVREEDAPFKEGDRPTLKLLATNNTDAEARINWTATLNHSDVSSMLSRVPTMPKALWNKSDMLVLAPRQTKTLTLATDTVLPKGIFRVHFSAEKQSISALNFTIGSPLPPMAANAQ